MSDTKLAALDRGLRPQRRREIVDRPARDLVLQEFVIEARVVAKHRPDQERVRRVRVGANFAGSSGRGFATISPGLAVLHSMIAR